MLILRQTKEFAKAVLPQPLVSKVQSWLFLLSISRIKGFRVCLKSPDRNVLEDIIIPCIVRCNEFNKILFVGSMWYI